MYLVGFGIGAGPYTPGQATLAGTSNDGAVVNTWNFTRP
jgi:hypothetical protein